MREGNTNRRLPYGESARNLLYAQYRSRAERDHRSWELTLVDFIRLTQRRCDYCGTPPSQKYLPNRYTNGAYVYNGIDRKDNLRGYEPDNCVACCYVCNVAKATMTETQFLAWVKRVYSYLGLGVDNA